MELVELHVGQLGAGAGGEGDAVAGGYGGVGGVGVDLACAAGGDEDGAGGDSLRVVGRSAAMRAGNRQIGADDAAAGGDQAGDHGPLGKADALVDAGKGDQGTADLGAGGVAAGVQDAGERMSAFAGAE
jgi:hypothetical protein